jgi:hypothetical protein
MHLAARATTALPLRALAWRAQVPDIGTGFALRERLYAYTGLPAPPTPPQPGHRVLLWLRRDGFPRSITNTQAMIDIIESYGLNYT